MNLNPLPGRVIVRGQPTPEQTAWGLIMPYAADMADKGGPATVVAAGPGCSVAAGDTVLVGKYGAQTVQYGGEQLLVLRDEDILCVVEQ